MDLLHFAEFKYWGVFIFTPSSSVWVARLSEAVFSCCSSELFPLAELHEWSMRTEMWEHLLRLLRDVHVCVWRGQMSTCRWRRCREIYGALKTTWTSVPPARAEELLVRMTSTVSPTVIIYLFVLLLMLVSHGAPSVFYSSCTWTPHRSAVQSFAYGCVWAPYRCLS